MPGRNFRISRILLTATFLVALASVSFVVISAGITRKERNAALETILADLGRGRAEEVVGSDSFPSEQIFSALGKPEWVYVSAVGDDIFSVSYFFFENHDAMIVYKWHRSSYIAAVEYFTFGTGASDASHKVFAIDEPSFGKMRATITQ